MKKIIFLFFGFFLPFTTFLVRDEPSAALMALVLQGSILGWPVASFWAIRDGLREMNEKKNQKKAKKEGKDSE